MYANYGTLERIHAGARRYNRSKFVENNFLIAICALFPLSFLASSRFKINMFTCDSRAFCTVQKHREFQKFLFMFRRNLAKIVFNRSVCSPHKTSLILYFCRIISRIVFYALMNPFCISGVNI